MILEESASREGLRLLTSWLLFISHRQGPKWLPIKVRRTTYLGKHDDFTACRSDGWGFGTLSLRASLLEA